MESRNETVYVVVCGDTLRTITQTHLGDKMHYPEFKAATTWPTPVPFRLGKSW
jgi:hypothetical protein